MCRLPVRASANIVFEVHDLELLTLVQSIKSNYHFVILKGHIRNQVLEGDFNDFPYDLDPHHVPRDALVLGLLVLILPIMEIRIRVQYSKGNSHSVEATLCKPVWRGGCRRVKTI